MDSNLPHASKVGRERVAEIASSQRGSAATSGETSKGVRALDSALSTSERRAWHPEDCLASLTAVSWGPEIGLRGSEGYLIQFPVWDPLLRNTVLARSLVDPG